MFRFLAWTDVDRLRALLDDEEVARNLKRVPFPYVIHTGYGLGVGRLYFGLLARKKLLGPGPGLSGGVHRLRMGLWRSWSTTCQCQCLFLESCFGARAGKEWFPLRGMQASSDFAPGPAV